MNLKFTTVEISVRVWIRGILNSDTQKTFLIPVLLDAAFLASFGDL